MKLDVEVTIDALGPKGDGIAEIEGQRLFVPFTVPGDRVRVRLRDDAKGPANAAVAPSNI
jgi:23S rRNA (uracil1939-C5)-methyltransferase